MTCSCKIEADNDIGIYICLLSKICHTVCLLRLLQRYPVLTSFTGTGHRKPKTEFYLWTPRKLHREYRSVKVSRTNLKKSA